MNQKRISIKSEIIMALLKKETHGREISEYLKVPLTTIQRTLSSLEQDNVIDYKIIGKSKVYFIKKSLSARKYVSDAENYKMIKLIGHYPYLEPLIKDILNVKSHLVILFGSYAKFNAKKDSDIDLYIETDKLYIKKETESKNSRLSVKIGLFNPDDLLIKEIIKNHVIIKGVDEFYEKTKLFD
ncbi:hypothetical protein GQ472_03235 [archaeon]|nr:hypothetical protein [archaeon]